MIKIINILTIVSMLQLSCSKPDSDSLPLDDSYFDFTPEFMGGASVASKSTPVPAQGLIATQVDATIKLTWNIPKTYLSKDSTIAYVVFRKIASIDQQDEQWDLSSAFSEDFTKKVFGLHAYDCEASGVCTFTDQGLGIGLYSYAVVAFADSSALSENFSAAVSLLQGLDNQNIVLIYDETFAHGTPHGIIGNRVGEADRIPDLITHNLKHSKLPWYLIDSTKAINQQDPSMVFRAPIFSSVLPNQTQMLFSDIGFNRVVLTSKGDLDSCSSEDPGIEEICRNAILNGSGFNQREILGQASKKTAFEVPDNPLPTNRVFQSGAVSSGTGESGTVYTFVSDDQRILVRKGSVQGCEFDELENEPTQEGKCGFQISLGTFSPKQRCAHIDDGNQKVGDDDCSLSDYTYSLADTTAPTNYSLRMPSSVAILGKDLYIADSGNSRIVRISDFESKISSCGQTPDPSLGIVGGFCEFDMVIGQYSQSETTPFDPIRFNYRDCIRGGERGGRDHGALVNINEPFSDPLSQGASGGASCRLDTYNEIEKSRFAGDYKDTSRSDLSPETGLLADDTRRRFRAPLHFEFREKFDDLGNSIGEELYVLDHGYTYAQVNSPLGKMATLPPRVMVWRSNPFKVTDCLAVNPDDPQGPPPVCEIDANGICSGDGCFVRQCKSSECNASFVIGQNNSLFGYQHKHDERLGIDYFPLGYYPISSFSLGKFSGMEGLWIVSGIDNSLGYFSNPSQTAKPIYSNKPSSELNALYNGGIFSSLVIDQSSGLILGVDSKQSMLFGWRGRDESVDNGFIDSPFALWGDNDEL